VETKVVKSIITNLDLIAKCHIRSFPASLASALGLKFVKVMLSWYLSSDKVFLFHIVNNQNVVTGYCGGIVVDGTLSTGSDSGMAQHTFWSAILAFITHPWVLFHPEVLAKWPVIKKNILVRLGFKKKNHFTKTQQQIMSKEPRVGLVVIGVDPKCQGKGYGSLLLQEFERKAVEEYGIKNLQLTVLANNQKAIRAYEKNGWQRGTQSGNSLSMFKVMG
jgi:ribosomal protein S18 acetylase RimI-like enzyme